MTIGVQLKYLGKIKSQELLQWIKQITNWNPNFEIKQDV